MSNRVLIKRGLSTNLSNAGVVAGELKYATDTNKLYIGTGTENIEIGAGGNNIIEIDYLDELPTVSPSLLGKIYYVRDNHCYYYVRGINAKYNFLADYCPVNEELNQKISYKYQYISGEDKVYKVDISKRGYDYVKVTTSTPGSKGAYPDNTLILCQISTVSGKLYYANSLAESGYVELTNFTYSYYTRENASNTVAGNFFFCNSYDQIYYIDSITWSEIEVERVSTRPPVEKRYANKYYYIPNYIYYYYAEVEEELSWEQLKTDVDLAKLKSEMLALLNNKFDYIEYSYQLPNASAETMGKLYVWKEYSYYYITKKNGTFVNKIAETDITEPTEEIEVIDFGGTSFEMVNPIYKEYMEGLFSNRPNVNAGCKCYYATDQNKYYVLSASTGGLYTLNWREVEMTVQSYRPDTGSKDGYYKVASGNIVTIYQVVTEYSWFDISEDQHPDIYAQRVSGTIGYDAFKFQRFNFDYEEKSLSSMNTGYIYGVIEDA